MLIELFAIHLTIAGGSTWLVGYHLNGLVRGAIVCEDTIWVPLGLTWLETWLNKSSAWSTSKKVSWNSSNGNAWTSFHQLEWAVLIYRTALNSQVSWIIVLLLRNTCASTCFQHSRNLWKFSPALCLHLRSSDQGPRSRSWIRPNDRGMMSNRTTKFEMAGTAQWSLISGAEWRV